MPVIMRLITDTEGDTRKANRIKGFVLTVLSPQVTM